jgi:hypothetical protein
VGAEPLIFTKKTDKGNIRAAALRFASTGRKPDFDLLEPLLKFASRYEAAVAGLSARKWRGGIVDKSSKTPSWSN